MNTTQTSQSAYSAIIPQIIPLKYKIEKLIRDRGRHGATAEEIETKLSIRGSTVRPRLVELRADGLIGRSGVTRATTSGRQAEVHVLSRYISTTPSE